jgi:glycerol-3-phosphate dehydrogenase
MQPSRRAPTAIIIGGGATGCAVARDLLLRGFQVTLVDRGDLGSGTSSRFHGMLQSGARYAVSDTEYAAECMRERQTVAHLIPSAVEPVGGLFVSLGEDPDDYADRFEHGCQLAGIPVREIKSARTLENEPSISRSVRRAFEVPDATINPWRLVNGMAEDISRRGGLVLPLHRAAAIGKTSGGGICANLVNRNGTRTISADVVVNASGAWSRATAALAGQSVELELTKGSILVLARRIVGRVINRCRYPSSHDIMVPTGTVSLFGTTSEIVVNPDTTFVRTEEVQQLLDGAASLIPRIREFAVLRAWAGVRPLYKPDDWPAGKAVPRRHKVIDHGETGFAGLFTVCGGSLTTHRSMAEDVCDRVCNHVGSNAVCESASVSIEGAGGAYWTPAKSFERVEAAATRPTLICECELVSVSDVEEAIAHGVNSLHDLRRRLRLGFGPCQGTFCAPRAAQLLLRAGIDTDAEAELTDFWAERLKGMVLTAWGKQARQILLGEHVHHRLMGLGSDTNVRRGFDEP